MPRDDAVALSGPSIRARPSTVLRAVSVSPTYTGFEEVAVVDAEERTAAFRKIFDAHAEHRVEHEQRIDDGARMTERLARTVR